MNNLSQGFDETKASDMREDSQTILSAAIVRDANELLEDVVDNGWNAALLSDIDEAIRLLQMAKKECQ